MLDWIFEGIVNWVSSIVSQMMDAVSGLFLQALGTDMTAKGKYSSIAVISVPSASRNRPEMASMIWVMMLATQFAAPSKIQSNIEYHLMV